VERTNSVAKLNSKGSLIKLPTGICGKIDNLFHETYVATMKSLLCIAALVFASFVPLSGTELSSNFEEYMTAQVKANNFNGSILIAQNGKQLLSKGYGMADVKLNVRNTPSTKFRLGPITQQFTAMAILELEEEGKLDVQDSVCKYILECPQNWQEIKIVNLLTHTSGILDLPEDDRTIMLPAMFPELLARFENKPLEFKPGEKLMFSNFGYEVLGTVIDRVSGEPYTKYVAEHIFEPLGMRDSGYDSAIATIPLCASGYRRDGARNTLVNATCSDKSISDSAGGLYSTVEDLYRWVCALHDGKLVSKKSLNQMFTPYRDGYGFGWKILKEFQRKVYAYAGRINGFSTSIRRYPDDNVCVIVLSNLESVNAEKISHDLGAILFDVHYGPSIDHHVMR
jgi:CubicO group peptidase (beta-lactamase class C family)